MKNGGPAFPHVHGLPVPAEKALYVEKQEVVYHGLSVRDYFAAAALTGIVAVLHEGIRPDDIPMMAKDCYAVADAMLTERDRK